MKPDWERVEGEVFKLGRSRLYVRYYQKRGSHSWCSFHEASKIDPEAPFLIEITKLSPGNVIRQLKEKLGVDDGMLAALLGTEDDVIRHCISSDSLPTDAEALRMVQVLGKKLSIAVPAECMVASVQEKRAAKVAETLARMLPEFRNALPQLERGQEGVKAKRQLIKSAEKALSEFYPAEEEEPEGREAPQELEE